MSKYAVAGRAGISRDMVGDIESGRSIPTLYLAAKFSYAVGLTLTQLIRLIEDV